MNAGELSANELGASELEPVLINLIEVIRVWSTWEEKILPVFFSPVGYLSAAGRASSDILVCS